MREAQISGELLGLEPVLLEILSTDLFVVLMHERPRN